LQVGLRGNKIAGVVLSIVSCVGLFSSFAFGVTVWDASLSFMRYRKKLKKLCPPENDPEYDYTQWHRNKWIIRLELLPSSLVPLMPSAPWIVVMLLCKNAPAN